MAAPSHPKLRDFHVSGPRASPYLRLITPIAALRRTLKRTGKLSLRLTVKLKDPAGTIRTVRNRITPKLKRR